MELNAHRSEMVKRLARAFRVSDVKAEAVLVSEEWDYSEAAIDLEADARLTAENQRIEADYNYDCAQCAAGNPNWALQ